MTATIAADGTRLAVAGTRLAVPSWRSCHHLPGASSWWDRCGIHNGWFTNLNPDQGAIAQPNNSGARCAVYQETGRANITVTTTWAGNHGGGVGGPMVCVDPDDNDFGLCFLYEYDLFDGTWVLWAMGRQPDDLRVVASLNDPDAHVDEVDMVVSMVVDDGEVRCYADDVLKITEDIPAGLVGSTLHGIAVDVNAAVGRPANLPVIQAPYTITRN